MRTRGKRVPSSREKGFIVTRWAGATSSRSEITSNRPARPAEPGRRPHEGTLTKMTVDNYMSKDKEFSIQYRRTR